MADTPRNILINPYAPQPAQPVRLRDISLLLGGGLIVGLSLGLIAVAVARFFTHSKFVAGIISGTTVYGSWLVGYQWLAEKRGCDRLQARFSMTRPKVLLLAAASGICLIVLIRRGQFTPLVWH